MLTASVGYLRAQYESFPFLDPASGNILDRSGTDLQNSPEWTMGLSAAYSLPIGPGEASMSLRWTYTDEKYLGNLLNTPRGTVQPTRYLDGNIKWAPDDGDWAVNIWGTNLLDDRYTNSMVDGVGFIGLMSYGAPRQVGVSLEMEF